MRSILAAAAIALLFAACDSPTAPRGFADGSVRFHDLNPQPLPPGLHLSTAQLNPQPLPPGLHLSTAQLNPQPLPPGLRASAIHTSTARSVGTYACRVGTFEPPDPCNTGFAALTVSDTPENHIQPPGSRRPLSVPGSVSSPLHSYACRVGTFQPPDPCSY